MRKTASDYDQMNEPPYRGPSRPPNSRQFLRDPRSNPAPEPNYDEEPTYRPPRGPRDPGGVTSRRPPREPVEPVMPAGRYFPGGPDDPGAGYERRPPRGPRPPDWNPEQAPPRRRRSPPMERPGREYDEEPQGRDGWRDPRAAPDWEPGRRPSRRSRPPDRAPAQKKSAAPRKRLHWRYRYGALLGIIVFASICGVCMGYAGLGSSRGVDGRLIAASMLAMLVGLGCAFVYVYY